MRHFILAFALFTGTLASVVAASAQAATQSPKRAELRSTITKPLKRAAALMKEQRYTDALGVIRETDSVENKTHKETLAVARMRGMAAMGAGDRETAGKAWTVFVASDEVPVEHRLKIAKTMAEMFYNAKDYPPGIGWANRYLALGGADPDMQLLIGQSHYLSGNYAAAERVLKEQIAASEKQLAKPTKEWLLLLADCEAKLNDEAARAKTLEKIRAYYPEAKKEGARR